MLAEIHAAIALLQGASDEIAADSETLKLFNELLATAPRVSSIAPKDEQDNGGSGERNKGAKIHPEAPPSSRLRC